MPFPVALLTDFGDADPYAGQLRGTLAALAPGAPVIDLSHGVEPFNVAQGAFFLAASLEHFPPGTVFLAVVDPGVGGPRRLLALAAAGRTILAPDNGLAGLVLARHPGARVFDLSAHAHGAASHTFHGRDVLAPLAARLARGEAPAALGPALDPAALVRPGWTSPAREATPGGTRILAAVIHVDRFGNCVLNLDARTWGPPLRAAAAIVAQAAGGPARPARAVRAYAELAPGELGLLAGSQGYLELACNQAPAARALAARCAAPLTLTLPGAHP
jgi:hypothetical protein